MMHPVGSIGPEESMRTLGSITCVLWLLAACGEADNTPSTEQGEPTSVETGDTDAGDTELVQAGRATEDVPDEVATGPDITTEPEVQDTEETVIEDVATIDDITAPDDATTSDIEPLEDSAAEGSMSDVETSAASDTIAEDSAADSAGSTEDVALAGDAQAADTEAESCEAIKAEADEQLLAAGAGCGAADSCTWFEFPICGTFGCYSGAIRKDTPEESLSALSAVGLEGLNAGCEPFHCGCGFPEGTPVCLADQCRMCPGDCGESCDDISAAIEVFAAEVSTGCSSDNECEVLMVSPCDLGSAITCHGLPHHVNADLGPIQKLLDGAPSAGCEFFACDCQLSQAVCDAGTCVGKMN